MNIKPSGMKDYDATINAFLRDVMLWLDERTPRDTTEAKEIDVTKEMWNNLGMFPRKCVEYENLYNYVCACEDGFSVKDGVGQIDNRMRFAVNDVLSAMDYYYRIDGDFQKLNLAKAILNVKKLTANNLFKKMKYRFISPEKVIVVTKQR
jgi:hypothetical protein